MNTSISINTRKYLQSYLCSWVPLLSSYLASKASITFLHFRGKVTNGHLSSNIKLHRIWGCSQKHGVDILIFQEFCRLKPLKQEFGETLNLWTVNCAIQRMPSTAMLDFDNSYQVLLLSVNNGESVFLKTLEQER